MTKNEIADVLTEIATLLQLKGENPFKVRAYETGARAIEGIEEAELGKLIQEEQLKTVKGIGDALGQKITELYTTGKLEYFEKLKASIPPGLVEMSKIPGLGPKKIQALQEKLGITDIASLAAACTDGRVAELQGFGEKTAQKILAGIKNREAYGKRHLWWEASAVAAPIVEGLRKLPQVKRAESAGSLRRGMETVGDLDFIVAASDVAPVMDWFCAMPGVKEVTGRGDTKSSVRFESGLQADLRIVPEEQFVFALHHFTGSKDHNVQMRQRALARGLSMSEWGFFPADNKHGPSGERAAAGKPGDAGSESGNGETAPTSGPMARSVVKATTEEGLFKALGLRFVPPELREGMGEIEFAEKGDFPRLVEALDLRGAFHNHTTASDGSNTLAEMTAAAEQLGWEYLGLADHSKSSFQANGMSEERLLKQIADVEALNAARKFKTHVFTGVECDILPDGRLDYDDAILAKLDYIVASVHNVLTQDEATMTARIIKALEHPCTTMLGHLTGRLLLRREGYKVDAVKVIDAAIANGVIIELNASPMRLDMDWRLWRKAGDKGLMCAINPDAHATEELGYVRGGINAARKSGLVKERILNTRPLAEVKAYFAARKKKR